MKPCLSFRRLSCCVVLSGMTAWSACDRDVRSGAAPREPGAPAVRILCSFTPVQVFTLNVVHNEPGVAVEVLLPPTAGCPHDYEISTRDARRIADADVIVLLGAIDAGVRATAERLGARATLIVADHGTDVHADCEHAETDGHDHDHAAANEHTWISPRRAIEHVRAIAEGLAAADGERAAAYRRNAEAYVQRLAALEVEIEQLADRVRGAQIVTVHNVFDALAADLGLMVAATIRTPEAGDPSPRRVAEIIEAVRESGVRAVFTEPQYRDAVAQRIANEAGVPCRELDPMATGPAEPPLDYYETTLRRNLATLTEVLTDERR